MCSAPLICPESPLPRRLYVDQALHKANITVDELGTTAAAVTAITARAVCRPFAGPHAADHLHRRPAVRVSRSWTRRTGALLFIGSVANPSAESSLSQGAEGPDYGSIHSSALVLCR